jgi:hypothetical protein
MPRAESEAAMQRNWLPAKLEGEAIPQWLEGLPSTLVHSVYAGGIPIPGLCCSDSDVASADLMGSIEVYRYSPDNLVALNRDWHPIIKFASSDSMLLLRGPISDSDHWLDKIPDRLRGAEILRVPPSHADVPEGPDSLEGAS